MENQPGNRTMAAEGVFEIMRKTSLSSIAGVFLKTQKRTHKRYSITLIQGPTKSPYRT